MSNKSKIILVTGAGKGIGNSTVNFLLGKGFYVYALVKDKKDNKNLRFNRNLKVINGNVNNFNLIKKIFSDANKNNKVITGLVNNAGITRDNIVLRMSEEEWQDIMNVNLNCTVI